MGKKTKSPHDTRAEISDLLVKQTTQDCPLARKGDIRFVVAWLHDESPVSGVPVTLTGPSPGQGATDGQGQVTFKKRTPGGYSYDADFSGAQAKMPVAVAQSDSASVKGDKLVTIFLYIEELGAIDIKVMEKDGDTVLELLPKDSVTSIAAGGQSVAKVNTKKVERIPAGDVVISVKVAGPEWLLLSQDMSATIKPGETTVKEIYAQRQSWIAFKVRDVDAGVDVESGVISAKLTDRFSRARDLKAAKDKLYFPKSDDKTEIEHVETTTGAEDDRTLYEFVKMS